MALFEGPTPPPNPTDLTYDAAEESLVSDVKRLGQYHRIEGWGVLGSGTRYLVCSCNRKACTESVWWDHILKALARERGPIRGPDTGKRK